MIKYLKYHLVSIIYHSILINLDQILFDFNEFLVILSIFSGILCIHLNLPQSFTSQSLHRHHQHYHVEKLET